MVIPGSFPFDHAETFEGESAAPSLTLSKGLIHQRRRARPNAKLRVVIICGMHRALLLRKLNSLENVMPRVDGVTRTLGRLLQHLDRNGHQALVLCPETPLKEYCHTQLIGTAGIPLVCMLISLSQSLTSTACLPRAQAQFPQAYFSACYRTVCMPPYTTVMPFLS